MMIHYKQSITQGIVLLERWQTDMAQFNIHTRSHLVHHLRCINLNDIADRYIIVYSYVYNVSSYTVLLYVCYNRLKYNQLQLAQTTGPGLAEAVFLSQVYMNVYTL